MSLYEFNDYKGYVRDRISRLPAGGRGELGKLASALKIHTTRVSHVFRGNEHLTLEQGYALTKYFGLNPRESNYFFDLLQHAKAGTPELRTYFNERLERQREKALDFKHRLPAERILKEQERATFYSNWFYSAIRLCTDLPGDHTVDSLSRRFALPRKLVSGVVDFLVSTGLCVKKEGKLRLGSKNTHLEATSPLVTRLHANWRLKAIESHANLGEQSFAYTGPMSIRKEDAVKIRRLLVESIERASKYSESDGADALYCLNVDWFEF